MGTYKIELEEEGLKRELELTSDEHGGKKSSSKNAVYTITENGSNLGTLTFKNGKYHYDGDEDFSPDDVNLLAAAITANRKETVIDSVEDDLDDDEDIE